MFSASPLALSLAAGLGLGIAYTLSPLTVWVTAGFLVMLRYAGRDLPSHERRWLLGLLGVAFLLRVAAIGALFLGHAHDSQSAGILFGDEAYALTRSWRMRNVLLDIPQLKYDYMTAYEDYGRSSFLWVMTYLQVLAGPAPYGLRVLNVAMFLGAVLLLFRMARLAFGSFAAFSGAVVLLFLPTLFFWSISLLKEPFYFVLTVLVLAAAVSAAQATTWRTRILSVTVAIVALWALRDLRAGALTLAVSGLVGGITTAIVSRRPWRLAAASAAALIAAIVALATPAPRQVVLGNIDRAAAMHAGHVFTVGHAYKLLDEAFYVFPDAAPRFALTPSEAGRFVVRAGFAYLFAPLPWQMATAGELAYLPEQLLWYLLVLLAPIGLVAAFRRDRFVASLLFAYLLPTAVVVALTTGNVGTLIRHRTLIIPYLVWVSCLGFAVTFGRFGAPEVPAR
jgi:hypothetical protein